MTSPVHKTRPYKLAAKTLRETQGNFTQALDTLIQRNELVAADWIRRWAWEDAHFGEALPGVEMWRRLAGML